MFVLNVMSTWHAGYYGRNTKVKENLEDYMLEYAASDEIINKLNAVANLIEEISLPRTSLWWNKANFFTMVCELASTRNLAAIDIVATSAAITAFENAPPPEFLAAGREAVNNKPERVIRGEAFKSLLNFEPEPAAQA